MVGWNWTNSISATRHRPTTPAPHRRRWSPPGWWWRCRDGPTRRWPDHRRRVDHPEPVGITNQRRRPPRRRAAPAAQRGCGGCRGWLRHGRVPAAPRAGGVPAGMHDAPPGWPPSRVSAHRPGALIEAGAVGDQVGHRRVSVGHNRAHRVGSHSPAPAARVSATCESTVVGEGQHHRDPTLGVEGGGLVGLAEHDHPRSPAVRGQTRARPATPVPTTTTSARCCQSRPADPAPQENPVLIPHRPAGRSGSSVTRWPGAGGCVRIDIDFVGPLDQAAQQRRRGDHLHVAAGRPVVDGLEVHLRRGAAQLVQHSDLGRHQNLFGVRVASRVQHAAGGQDLHPVRGTALTGEVQRRGGATAFWVDVEFGVRMAADLRAPVPSPLIPAWTWHSPPRRAGSSVRSSAGRGPQNWSGQTAPRGRPDRLHHFHGVGRGAANIGQRAFTAAVVVT